jgi:hypothetical protein
MSKTLSRVPLEGPDGTISLPGRMLHRIATWIIRRALRRAEVALRNDRTRRHIDRESTAGRRVLCGTTGTRMTRPMWSIPAEHAT